MYQLIALYKQPENAEAFDRAYRETHVPLVLKVPGLASIEASKVVPGRDGQSPYYQMAVLSFPDKDTYKAAMKSPEMAEAGKNLEAIAPGRVEFLTAETVELT